jgi:hypothetical protein
LCVVCCVLCVVCCVLCVVCCVLCVVCCVLCVVCCVLCVCVSLSLQDLVKHEAFTMYMPSLSLARARALSVYNARFSLTSASGQM